MIEFMEFITRKDLKNNPHKIFLFGDNLTHEGLGGQAKEMRGEPNAVGIPTKKKPSMDNGSFFSDDEFEENKRAIDESFNQVYEKGGKNPTVVVPLMGIGTGFANLPRKAPRTYQYILMKIKEFEGR